MTHGTPSWSDRQSIYLYCRRAKTSQTGRHLTDGAADRRAGVLNNKECGELPAGTARVGSHFSLKAVVDAALGNAPFGIDTAHTAMIPMARLQAGSCVPASSPPREPTGEFAAYL